jgi:putative flippase GtrA
VRSESSKNDPSPASELSWIRKLRNKPWMARIASHIPPAQFGSYLLVGSFNTLFGYGSFAVLTALLSPLVPASYLPAILIASPINITVAFLGYKWFVFRTKGNYFKEWTRCIAVYLSSTLGSLVLLPILVATLHYGFGMQKSAPYLAGALMTGFGVIYNFFGLKKFSFRNDRAGQ